MERAKTNTFRIGSVLVDQPGLTAISNPASTIEFAGTVLR